MRVPLTILAVIALAACGSPAGTTTPTGGGTATPAAAAVQCNATGSGTAATIANFAFAPNPVTVSTGGVVTWTNNDTTAHTVTFDSGPDCGQVNAGASVTVSFGAAGTYPFHCTIHSSMKGSVTVNG